VISLASGAVFRIDANVLMIHLFCTIYYAAEIFPSVSVLTVLHENLPATSHCKWLKVVFLVHAVKAYMRSGGIVPLILNLYPFGGGCLNFHEGRSVRG
jgi:hypothetical protein